MDRTQDDIYLMTEEILQEIHDLKKDVKEQYNNGTNPEVIASTLQQILSLTTDLDSLRAIMFTPDALKMEEIEKEFFFKQRIPRAMKTIKRHHN